MGQIVFQATLGGQVAVAGPNTASSFTLTLPAATDTLVGKATTDTLTNKTLTSPTITGATLTTSAFNGTVGATTASTGAFTTLSTSSTTTLSGLTASTALALDASKNVVSVTNTGTGSNVLSASPTLTGTIAGASLSLSSLTSGRVTYAGASGLLTDSANFTYGTGLSVNGISQVYQTGLYTTDGTLSNYSVNNGVYLNGNATGWSQLSGDGTRATFVRVWGSGASPANFIVLNTAGSERMRVDSSGNVGIGTSSPAQPLQITNNQNGSTWTNVVNTNAGTGSASGLLITSDTAQGAIQITSSTNVSAGTTANTLWIRSIGSYPITLGTNSTTQLTLDTSGNLGLGVTPTTWTNGKAIEISGTNYGVIALEATNATSTFRNWALSSNYNNAGELNFIVGASQGAKPSTVVGTIDSSGNLGLGVTPSAWSGYRAMQLGSCTSLWSGATAGSNASSFYTNNGYFNGANRIYLTNGYASEYIQGQGQHIWYTAPSGTAGNAITFTQAMTLDASGNLLVGGTSALVSGAGRGNITINGTSSSVLSFGASNVTKAYIFSDGTNLDINNQANGYMTFDTNALERMRIDSSGNVLVGQTSISTTTAGIALQKSQGANIWAMNIAGAASTSSNYAHYVYSTTASAYRFLVDYAGTIFATSTSITAISDQTLKTNIKPLETGLNEVMKLQPRRFDWINGDATNVAGFVAQEVQEVLPDLVGDYKYSDTETKLGLKMGDMIPTLVKAIQELKTEFDAYKATHP